MKSNEFFLKAKPSRLFFTVAIPGMISMLAMSVYSVIEGVFIGNMLGEAAFAAVNIAMPFVMINFSLADMIGVGSSVPISVYLGKGEKDKANNYFTCSLIMIFLAAVFMGIVLYFSAPVLVRLMGAEGLLARLSVKYVRVYAVMGPITTLVFAMDNYLRICGFVRGSMVLNIFMSLLTAVLLYIFIGVVGLNVEGSALATSLAMAFCAIVALVPFLFGKTVLRLVKPRFSLMLVKKVVSSGMPTFLNNIAGRVASIIMNVALIKIGGQTAVAVYSVLMYASDIIQPMLYGMTDSVQPAVGYNWGAKQFDRVKGITKCSFAALGIISFLGTAVMFLFPRQITGLFVGGEDKVLMEMSVRAMRIFCIAYLFRWFGFAVQGFFSAIEKPAPASVLSVASAMVFPIILIFALMPLGLDGLWLNLAGTSFLVSVMAVFMLIRVQKSFKSLHN